MPYDVTVTISGAGTRVSAYVIDRNILNQLRNTTGEGALYEGNPISVVGNIAKDHRLVSLGLCIDTNDLIRCSVFIGTEETKIEKLGILYKGTLLKEEFETSKINSTLIAREEMIEDLGADLKIKKNQMLVLEIAEYKFGELRAMFVAEKKPSVQDIELGMVRLDAVSSLSDATYGTGLLSGMEFDIRYAIHNGVKYEFELDVLNGYASKFWLVTKDDEGNWIAELLE